MDIKRGYMGLGDRNSEGFLTFLIYPNKKSEFTVHHPDKSGSTTVTVENNPNELLVKLSGVQKPHILNINLNKAPREIKLDGKLLSDSVDYRFDTEMNKLIIRTKVYSGGKYVIQK